MARDLNLSVLFNVIDTNSDNQLSKAEFKQKLRALHIGLEEEEMEGLFQDLDARRAGYVTYNSFVE